MTALLWIIAAVVLCGVGYMAGIYVHAWLAERKYRERTGGGSLYYRRGRVPLRLFAYRAVELKLCDDPCEVGLSIAGKRLLKADAPALPLPGCRFKKCACAYKQYDDRRIEQRRDTSLYGISTGKSRAGMERRKPGSGRRASDKPAPKRSS